MIKLYACSLILFITFAKADVELETVEVVPIGEAQETSGAKVLKGKKYKVTTLKKIPSLQTDSTRQSLASQPGIHTPEQTTEPWMILNYRGIGSPQEGQGLLILQDGLPVALDMYGSPDHYYSPPAPLMQKIELVAGGGALLYGPSPSATVNFLSPELSYGMPSTGKLNLAYGSYDLISSVNTLTGSSGKTSYYIGYHRKQGEGLQRTNGDFEADYLQLKGNYYSSSTLLFKSSFQGHSSDFGMPGGMSLVEGPGLNHWDRDNRKATRNHNRLKLGRMQLMVGAEKRIDEKTLIDLELWSNAYRKYNKTQLGSGFGKIPTSNNNTINTTYAYGLNGQVRLKHDYNDNSFSAGYLSYNTNSPSVNERGEAPDSNHGEITSRPYRTTRVQAVFAENKFQIGKVSLVPGVRFENITLATKNNDKENLQKISRSDTYNILLGGIGATYELSDSSEIFANVSQGFRPVGYEEVLSQGNPNYTVEGDLKSSYSYFHELGYNLSKPSYNWETSLFFIRRENILASSDNVLSNGSAAEYKGIETSLSTKLIKRFELFANYSFVNAQFKKGDFEGKTPAHAPASLVKFGITYTPDDRSRITLLNTYVHEHFSDDAHTSQYKVPSYHLQDLLAEYYLSERWFLNGGIYNLLDLNYYGRVMPTGVMPAMGRNMFLGVNYLIE